MGHRRQRLLVQAWRRLGRRWMRWGLRWRRVAAAAGGAVAAGLWGRWLRRRVCRNALRRCLIRLRWHDVRPGTVVEGNTNGSTTTSGTTSSTDYSTTSGTTGTVIQGSYSPGYSGGVVTSGYSMPYGTSSYVMPAGYSSPMYGYGYSSGYYPGYYGGGTFTRTSGPPTTPATSRSALGPAGAITAGLLRARLRRIRRLLRPRLGRQRLPLALGFFGSNENDWWPASPAWEAGFVQPWTRPPCGWVLSFRPEQEHQDAFHFTKLPSEMQWLETL